MTIITRKSEVRTLLKGCLQSHKTKGLAVFVDEVYRMLLSRKVKFPLLEFCGRELYTHLPDEEHMAFCDAIQKLKTEGGNVLLGIILQKRLGKHFNESVTKTTEYIADADIWYVCDIIGERVWGVSLLNEPEKTIAVIEKLAMHSSHWVIRSLGAGIHYAIKKGLPASHVGTLFKLLLQCADTKNKEIRQGIGWAAKTTARFHPEVIHHYGSDIENTEKVAHWFRKKITIGLDRNNYASGD